MKKLTAILIAMFLTVSVASVFAQEEPKTTPPAKEKKENGKEKKELNLPNRDIADIPVPSQLKLDKSGTFLFEAKNIKIGVLTYSGRVDGYTLGDRMVENLLEEKWKLINKITYKNTVTIDFVKDDRTCKVKIDEGWFSTTIEVRVGLVFP